MTFSERTPKSCDSFLKAYDFFLRVDSFFMGKFFFWLDLENRGTFFVNILIAPFTGIFFQYFLRILSGFRAFFSSKEGIKSAHKKEKNYPTLPSISSAIRALSSAAYSRGSSLTIGEINPLIIIAFAASSAIPRLRK